jgi:NADH:ubiquinone oxidoreductase subunit 4 (subunit M)
VIVSGANFFLFLAGPIALIYIIIGAYYFITSAGDEERADQGKRILLYTFLATILLLLSYTFLVEIVGLNLL